MSGTVLVPVQLAGRVVTGQAVQAPPLKQGNPPSTLEVGAGRFEPREANRLTGQVEVTELQPVET